MRTILRHAFSAICGFVMAVIITSPVRAQDSLAQYHPLAKGNIWIYKISHPSGSSYYQRQEVRGDSTIDGKQYRIIGETNSLDSISRTSVERYDTATGCYYTRMGNTDVLQDSTFTSTPNASFGGTFENRIFKSLKTETVLGAPRATREITEGNLIKEDVVSWSYAYGLGLVHADDLQLVNYIPSWVQTLVYARIDGIEYGKAPLADSLADVFPLKVGWQSTYDYTWKHDYNAYLTSADSGSITLLPIKETQYQDSTIWTVLETKLLRTRLHASGYYLPMTHIDTIKLTELKSGRHKLYRWDKTSISIDRTLLPWTSTPSESDAIYRYCTVDSLGRATSHLRVQSTGGDYSTTFQKDVGITSLRGNDGCTCLDMIGAVATLKHQEMVPIPSAVPDDVTRRAFYPLHQGDMWQYTRGLNYLPPEAPYYISVVDSLLPNGYRYAGLSGVYAPNGVIKFVRVDSLLRVQEYHPELGDTCGGGMNELNTYRLGEKDSSVWTVYSNMGIWSFPGKTLLRYEGMSADSMFMFFRSGNPLKEEASGERWAKKPFKLQRGVGVAVTNNGTDQETVLYGAFVNGRSYGFPLLLSVQEKQSPPVGYSLQQNYPNPFNPSTTITFSIPSRSRVSLKIYDVMGREVAALASEEMPPGNYSRQWNASGCASGVYFYRLQAGAYTETKRLVVLK